MSLPLAASELILNKDGSIYHLNIRPEQIAHDVITVGDPNRVDTVAKHLDQIELDVQNREFRTVTGRKDGKRWSIISTGIGTDNIDIVFTELDALVNIDLQNRYIKEQHTTLRFHRLGTSGTLREDIAVDSLVASALAVGLGGLLYYYKNGLPYIKHPFNQEVERKLLEKGIQVPTYVCEASPSMLDKVKGAFIPGITYTAPGFYGPQGRSLRLDASSKDYLDELSSLSFEGLKSTNLEMETAGIYGMAQMLGHEAISLNLILANRVTGEFTQRPNEAMDDMVKLFFEIFK